MNLKVKIESKCIRIDWKCPVDDTYALMLRDWIEVEDILSNKDFRALVVNYNSEPAAEYLPALGQELTQYDYILCTIDEKSDSYCLVLLEAQQLEEFKQKTKQEGISIEVQNQQERDYGQKAKRLKLAKSIQYSKAKLIDEGHLYYTLHWPFIAVEQRPYGKKGSSSEQNYFIADLRQWPPKVYPTGNEIRKLVSNENRWVGIFMDSENKDINLRISNNPLDDSSWKDIKIDSKFKLFPGLVWVNNDILVFDGIDLWLIEFDNENNPSSQVIFSLEGLSDIVFSKGLATFKTKSNKQYVVIESEIYEWQNKKLIPTGMTLEPLNNFDPFITGQNRFAYVSRAGLVEVDLKRKKTRRRKLDKIDECAHSKTFNDDWVVILRHCYTNKNIPIAQFWNPTKDLWKEINLGALGKSGIRDLIQTPNEILIEPSEYSGIFKIKNLDQIFASSKYDTTNPNKWSKNWYRSDFLGLVKKFLVK